jgi:DNA-binding transcriptional MerR regulator
LNGGGVMNISEISRSSGLPYSTTRKYLLLLERAGFFISKIVDGSREYPDDSERYVLRIAKLKNIGYKLDDCIEKLKAGDIEENTRISQLENKISDLTRQVYTLSDLLQKNLSSQPALSGGSFWYHIKLAFKSLFSGNKKSGK